MIVAVDPDIDDQSFCMCRNAVLGPVVITYFESVFGAMDTTHYVLTGQGNALAVEDVIEISKSEYSLNLSGNSGTDDVILTINGETNSDDV